jgi:hypothetical protein
MVMVEVVFVYFSLPCLGSRVGWDRGVHVTPINNALLRETGIGALFSIDGELANGTRAYPRADCLIQPSGVRE